MPRTRRTKEEWTALLARWAASGQSAAKFASTIPGLSARTLRTKVAEHKQDEKRDLDATVAELRARLATCTCRSADQAVASSATATNRRSAVATGPPLPDQRIGSRLPDADRPTDVPPRPISSAVAAATPLAAPSAGFLAPPNASLRPRITDPFDDEYVPDVPLDAGSSAPSP